MKLTYTLTLEGLTHTTGWKNEESRTVTIDLRKDCEDEAKTVLEGDSGDREYQDALELLEDAHVHNDEGRWEIESELFHERQEFRWNIKLESIDNTAIKNPFGGTTSK